MELNSTSVRTRFSTILFDYPRDDVPNVRPQRVTRAVDSMNPAVYTFDDLDPVSALAGAYINKMFDVSGYVDFLTLGREYPPSKARDYVSMLSASPLLSHAPKGSVVMTIAKGGEAVFNRFGLARVYVAGTYTSGGIRITGDSLIKLMQLYVPTDRRHVVDGWLMNEVPAHSREASNFYVGPARRESGSRLSFSKHSVKSLLSREIGVQSDTASPLSSMLTQFVLWLERVYSERYRKTIVVPDFILGGGRGDQTVPEKIALLDRFGTSLRYYVDGATRDTLPDLPEGMSVHGMTGSAHFGPWDFSTDERLRGSVAHDGKVYAILQNDATLVHDFRGQLLSLLAKDVAREAVMTRVYARDVLAREPGPLSFLGVAVPGPFPYVPIQLTFASSDGLSSYKMKSEVPPTAPLLKYATMCAEYVALMEELIVMAESSVWPHVFYLPGSVYHTLVPAVTGHAYVSTYLMVDGLYVRARASDVGVRYVSAPGATDFARGWASVFTAAYSCFGIGSNPQARAYRLELEHFEEMRTKTKVQLSGHIISMCIMPFDYFQWCLYELIENYITRVSIYNAPFHEQKKGRYHSIGDYRLGISFVKSLYTGLPGYTHVMDRVQYLDRVLDVIERPGCVTYER